MYIPGNNFSPLLSGLSGSSSLRGMGFASFSFSASIFSSSTLTGLNQLCGSYPRNPALNFLGGCFNSLSCLQSFGGCFGGGFGGGYGCCPQPPTHPPTQQGKMWDVFFDAKSGTKTQQWSPIVLDLNGNGQADITGSNIKGNGKLEGQTVKGFDLNPQDRQWETKSFCRRPGDGAPALGADVTAQVFDKNGNLVKTLSAEELKKLQAKKSAWNADGGDMGLGLGADMRAEFRDGNGRLVSELKRDGTNGNKPLYFWGNKNENEWTKAWDSKTGGDGMLVWDVDGDGKITSGKELMGTIDLDGKNTFKNGYEKLAKYFDKDGDGVVRGSELQGLKIWEDRNGDGITQEGELVDLSKHGITSLSTNHNEADMSSTYRFRDPNPGKTAPRTNWPRPYYQPAMQQTWQIFQMIEVMRLMQQWSFGLS